MTAKIENRPDAISSMKTCATDLPRMLLIMAISTIVEAVVIMKITTGIIYRIFTKTTIITDPVDNMSIKEVAVVDSLPVTIEMNGRTISLSMESG